MLSKLAHAHYYTMSRSSGITARMLGMLFDEDPTRTIGTQTYPQDFRHDVCVQTDLQVSENHAPGSGSEAVEHPLAVATELPTGETATVPRTRAAVPPPEWFGTYDIISHVKLNARTTQAVCSCRNLIVNLLEQGPTRFKIGITGNPRNRWYQFDDMPGQVAYYHFWDRMDLLACTHTIEAAKFLEVFLIDDFWDRSGCHNCQLHDRGGSGKVVIDDYGVCWIYVVSFAAKDRAIGLARNLKRQRV